MVKKSSARALALPNAAPYHGLLVPAIEQYGLWLGAVIDAGLIFVVIEEKSLLGG